MSPHTQQTLLKMSASTLNGLHLFHSTIVSLRFAREPSQSQGIKSEWWNGLENKRILVSARQVDHSLYLSAA
eukprot:6330434-Amphidinium_carterae.1